MRYRHLLNGMTVETDRTLNYPYELIPDPTASEWPTPDDATSQWPTSGRPLGGGWYEVRFPDGTTRKIRGRAQAEAYL